MKIILATDYSACSINAGYYALQFAAATGSELALFHAYNLSMGSIPADAAEFAKTRQKTREEEEDNLDRFGRELFKEWSYSGQLASEGSTGKSLAEWTEQMNAALIIAGTHGHGGDHRIFGSNAWDIIRRAEVPVLLVPPGARYTPVSHIVFGAEGRDSELPAIKLVAKIARKLGAKVTVLHISRNILSRDLGKEMFESFRRKLFLYLADPGFDIKCMNSENIQEGLNAFCNSSGASWLVMAHRQRSIFEKLFMRSPSATKRMSAKTQVPLLALPHETDHNLSEKWNFGYGGPYSERNLLQHNLHS